MNKEQQIKEMTQDFINLGITTRQGVEAFAEILYNAGYRKTLPNTELFTQNMKNVLEIEKKQAVKEFAEKLKANSVETKSPEWGFMDVVDVNEIDELLKEYEQ